MGAGETVLLQGGARVIGGHIAIHSRNDARNPCCGPRVLMAALSAPERGWVVGTGVAALELLSTLPQLDVAQPPIAIGRGLWQHMKLRSQHLEFDFLGALGLDKVLLQVRGQRTSSVDTVGAVGPT